MLTRRNLLASAIAGATSSIPVMGFAAKTPIPNLDLPALGLTLPVTGVQAEIARDLLDGYELAALASGGAFRVVALDDSSKPETTANNISALANDPRVLAVSGIVGTPHAKAALPVAVQSGLPVIGIRSGAESLRQGQEGVFHLRSSYEAELRRMASMFSGQGIRRVQVLYSNDAFGKESLATLTQSLDGLGIATPDPLSVERNGENLPAVVKTAADLCKTNDRIPTAIVLLLISAPCVSAAQALRSEHKVILPIYAMSHVVNRALATKPMPALAGFGVMLAFPLPRVSRDRVASKFRDTVAKANKPELRESLTAFEGFFYGSVFGQALKDAGNNPTRQSIVARMRAGVQVEDLLIRPNENNVGFHHVGIAYKELHTGFLRA